MSEIVIVTNDTVTITPPTDPPAVYIIPPNPLPVVGTSPVLTVRGVKACLPDDIEVTIVTPFTYTAAPYTTPGSGTFNLKLRGGNKTQKTTQKTTQKASQSKKPIVINGGTFDAEFTIITPAVNPVNGTPDPNRPANTKKTGIAQFTAPTVNTFFRAG
ncbi:hypothetical protein ABZ667_44245 [Streptomyces lavendulae]|uniref:hypothetical protein n=1 Tax=Streptomyces lavendulae TaxID=1914 RepID=UPI0033EE46B2